MKNKTLYNYLNSINKIKKYGQIMDLDNIKINRIRNIKILDLDYPYFSVNNLINNKSKTNISISFFSFNELLNKGIKKEKLLDLINNNIQLKNYTSIFYKINNIKKMKNNNKRKFLQKRTTINIKNILEKIKYNDSMSHKEYIRKKSIVARNDIPILFYPDFNPNSKLMILTTKTKKYFFYDAIKLKKFCL